jgi:mono/diheme cytochrome c family protein
MKLARCVLTMAGFLAALAALAARSPAGDASSPQSVEFFEKRVRPVLVEHCGKCHGDDPRKIKGGLRLDSRDALLKGGDSGPALVPGVPAKSRLVEALRYKNIDLQMPPKGKLPDAVIADFVAWIQAGAAWPDGKTAEAGVRNEFDLARRKAEHWAWRPVRRPEVPTTMNRGWPTSPVDAFVFAKLEEKSLSPAQPADRRTLLRRLSFDLTGLPPSPEEIDAFLDDQAPGAYERVVDRLLASPAYGERWARHWLDLVRYADSRGHEFDYPIPGAREYRDYVIRAFNGDVPYDRFVAEHVAGDLLPKPRKHPTEGFNESIIGTGFWLLGEEVHSPVDVRQDLADRLDNRIDVFSKAFLGLTLSCARCHDHKFDAISTKDYYALFGILEGGGPRLVRFDSLEQNRRIAAALARARQAWRPALLEALAADAASALERAGAYLLAAREVLLSRPPLGQEVALVVNAPQAAIAEAIVRKQVRDVASARGLDETLTAAWVRAVSAARLNVDDPLQAWAMIAVDPASGEPKRLSESIRRVADRLRQRDAESIAAAGSGVVIDFAKMSAVEWITDEGAFGPGPHVPGTPRVGAAFAPEIHFTEETAAVYDRAWDGISAAPGSEAEPGALGRRLRAGRTICTPSFTLTAGKLYYRARGAGTAYAAVEGHGLIAGPLHAQLLLDFKVGNDFRWVTHDLTPYKGCRVRLEFTPADSSDLAIARVVQAEREPASTVRPLRGLIELLPGKDVTSVETLAAGYERLLRSLVTQRQVDTANREEEAITRARFANWLLLHPGLLRGNAVHQAATRARAEEAAISADLRKESRLALALLDAPGVDERVFVRGSHKALGERVPRRFLEALAGTLPLTGPGSGRLELAGQVTDPERIPFLARVMVNRIWHHLFGRGIVASTDNFGVLGERPTHPELLDFLADEFVRQGWSVKTLIRTLVLSSTYRMDSRAEESADTADPDDLLLHRMRLRRLEGEAIRDAMLAVSGRLDSRPFGPAVPVHLTPFLDGRGRPASGPLDGNGRRSIYLAVRRNFLSPFLLAFDTPIPFSTVGRRTVSNVPAQALILLNDPFVHDQAAFWARQVLARAGTDRDRIGQMFVRAFGRPPADSEYESCLAFLRGQADSQVGPPDEERLWSDLAHTLFNAKEFIYIR